MRTIYKSYFKGIQLHIYIQFFTSFVEIDYFLVKTKNQNFNPYYKPSSPSSLNIKKVLKLKFLRNRKRNLKSQTKGNPPIFHLPTTENCDGWGRPSMLPGSNVDWKIDIVMFYPRHLGSPFIFQKSVGSWTPTNSNAKNSDYPHIGYAAPAVSRYWIGNHWQWNQRGHNQLFRR